MLQSWQLYQNGMARTALKAKKIVLAFLLTGFGKNLNTAVYLIPPESSDSHQASHLAPKGSVELLPSGSACGKQPRLSYFDCDNKRVHPITFWDFFLACFSFPNISIVSSMNTQNKCGEFWKRSIWRVRPGVRVSANWCQLILSPP